MYKYRTRPSGLAYKIVKDNPSWFQKGRDEPKGELAIGWKGGAVSYQELHRWVRKSKQKPANCEHCGGDSRPLEWANKSHEYLRSLDDWLALCKPCHRQYDSGEHWGKATAKFGSHALSGLAA